MREVYIQAGLRTPIGLYRGQYKDVRPEILAAGVLDELYERTRLQPDCLFLGNAVGPGGNIGRLASLYTRLPHDIPAVTLDMQCASGMMSIQTAYAHIKAGLLEGAYAGGFESSSLQVMKTYAAHDLRSQWSFGEKQVGQFKVAQFSPEGQDAQAMLWGAERTAQKYGFSRQMLDSFALDSHRKAQLCREAGCLQDYLVGADSYVDEGIRPRMSSQLLARMPLLLGPHTVTTAGNACLTHDGAAFVALTTQASDIRILAALPWAGDPLYSPEGAWRASEAILQRQGLSMDDIDIIEWNEAFAVIDAIFAQAYPQALSKYNVWGGALAYGHPYACSGALLVIHAMAALRYYKKRYGLCAIAGAGGTGTALLLEHI